MGELADRQAAAAHAEQGADDAIDLWDMENRSGILLTIQDKKGLLNECLKILDAHNIDMTGISSRPPKIQGDKKLVHINIDFAGNFEQDNVAAAMWRLTEISEGVTKVGSREVPWFPLHITDFDNIGKRVLSEGDGIQDADHPGFRDPEYRKRRDEINLIS